MAIGLLFGTLWLGIGLIMWWWPAAIFVAFSNEDVTPGARAFAIVSMLIGFFFFMIDIPVLTIEFSLPATVFLVGVLLLIKPVEILGVSKEGPVTPQSGGVALIICGVIIGVLVLV